MAPTIWIFLPLLIAAGSALLAFYIMQSRLDLAVAQERQSLAEAQAVIRSQERVLEERVKAAEEESHRRAFDQFLGEIRVEERQYMRESKSLFLTRKSLILQERLFFRNIPLSNWVEHEMVMEDGGDLGKLARRASAFSSRSLNEGVRQVTANQLLPE